MPPFIQQMAPETLCLSVCVLARLGTGILLPAHCQHSSSAYYVILNIFFSEI